MQEILLRELNGIGVDYTTRVTESMLARVHFIVRTDPANPPGDVDADALAEQLADATRLWDDDFTLVLERKLGDEQAKDAVRAGTPTRSRRATRTSTRRTRRCKDLAKLELLEEPGQLEMHLFRKTTADDANVRFKVFRYGEPMVLSAVLPVLHSLGVRVVDERPYEVGRADGTVYLYDFGLQLPDRAPRPGRGAPARGERVRGGLARRGRGRRLQRAGAARPGSPGGRWWCCGRTPSTCARPARSSRRSTWSRRSSPTRRSPRCWWRCSRSGSRPRLRLSDEERDRCSARSWSTRSAGSSTTWPASTRTGSCAPT